MASKQYAATNNAYRLTVITPTGERKVREYVREKAALAGTNAACGVAVKAGYTQDVVLGGMCPSVVEWEMVKPTGGSGYRFVYETI